MAADEQLFHLTGVEEMKIALRVEHIAKIPLHIRMGMGGVWSVGLGVLGHGERWSESL